jgi:hypothetical protein
MLLNIVSISKTCFIARAKYISRDNSVNKRRKWIRAENGDVDLILNRPIMERQKEETYSDMCCVLK